MRETHHYPEPIVVEGATLAAITSAIHALIEQGYDRREVRLFAGTPEDIETIPEGPERFNPGYYFNGVLVV